MVAWAKVLGRRLAVSVFHVVDVILSMLLILEPFLELSVKELGMC